MWKLHYGGCKIYFPTIPESEVIVSNPCEKLVRDCVGSNYFWASQRCVIVGCLLTINVCFGKLDGVTRWGKIYKWDLYWGGLGGYFRGKH